MKELHEPDDQIDWEQMEEVKELEAEYLEIIEQVERSLFPI